MFHRRLLMLGAALALLTTCTCQPVISHKAACGAELADTDILRAAQRWLSVTAPGVKVEDLNPIIQRESSGCNYAVIFPHRGLEAIEDVVVVVDRKGHVRNIPECCQLGDCPEFCKK